MRLMRISSQAGMARLSCSLAPRDSMFKLVRLFLVEWRPRLRQSDVVRVLRDAAGTERSLICVATFSNDRVLAYSLFATAGIIRVVQLHQIDEHHIVRRRYRCATMKEDFGLFVGCRPHRKLCAV